jgi:hypothetical protein
MNRTHAKNVKRRIMTISPRPIDLLRPPPAGSPC